MKNTNKPDVVLELSDTGLDQIRLYADTPEQREAGLYLLTRVAPELRALESALRVHADAATEEPR